MIFLTWALAVLIFVRVTVKALAKQEHDSHALDR